MASEPSKFFRDMEAAYNQVAANHEREVTIVSEAEDLTATVEYDSMNEVVVVLITVGTVEREDGNA